MTNEQIKQDFARFLETGFDYPEEMRQRDMKAVRQSELASLACLFLACLFLAGLMAGLVLAAVFGV